MKWPPDENISLERCVEKYGHVVCFSDRWYDYAAKAVLGSGDEFDDIEMFNMILGERWGVVLIPDIPNKHLAGVLENLEGKYGEQWGALCDNVAELARAELDLEHKGE